MKEKATGTKDAFKKHANKLVYTGDEVSGKFSQTDFLNAVCNNWLCHKTNFLDQNYIFKKFIILRYVM